MVSERAAAAARAAMFLRDFIMDLLGSLGIERAISVHSLYPHGAESVS
jgi:hypothetical protein